MFSNWINGFQTYPCPMPYCYFYPTIDYRMKEQSISVNSSNSSAKESLKKDNFDAKRNPLELSSQDRANEKNCIQIDKKSSREIERGIPRNRQNKFYPKEEEYIPYKGKNKVNQRVYENSNRNIIPNVMHQAISYLQKKCKSKDVVAEIMKRGEYHPNCSVKRFYLYQSMIKDKLSVFVSVDCLGIFAQDELISVEIFPKEEQMSYNQISRILIRYFFRESYDAIILTSKRVNSAKKIDHIQIKRILFDKLKNIFNE